MKVWVTRYALSAGIFSIEGDLTCDQKYFSEDPQERGFRLFLARGDFHDDLDAAMKKGEEMRIAKLASLQRQLDKMSKLKIKVKNRP